MNSKVVNVDIDSKSVTIDGKPLDDYIVDMLKRKLEERIEKHENMMKLLLMPSMQRLN